MRDSVEKVSLPGFRLVAADVNEIAKKAFERVWMQQVAPVFKETEAEREKLTPDDPEHAKAVARQQARNHWIFEMFDLLLKGAPETYKLWPWLARSWKKNTSAPGDPTLNPKGHVRDILMQATVHLGRLRDNPTAPVPDVMRDFKEGFPQLEQWVYDRNSEDMKTQLENDQTVFEYADGWKIVQVDSDNLGWEGEQMGHCVGGYCDQVKRGDTIIYSLRDPKNEPHVTFEIAGAPKNREEVHQHVQWNDPYPMGERSEWTEAPLWEGEYDETETPYGTERRVYYKTDQSAPLTSGRTWEVVQIQGKQDREPIDEYKARLKQFFTYLYEQGIQVEWSPNSYQHGYGYDDHTWYVNSPEELSDWWTSVQDGDYKLHQQREQERSQADRPVDDYGLPKPVAEHELSADPHGILETIIDGMWREYRDQGNYYNQYNELAEAFPALVHEYYAENDAPAVKKNIEDMIEKAYDQISQKADENRDMNWEYEHSAREEYWKEINEPDEEGEYPEMPEDTWDDERFEEFETQLADSWYEPWSRGQEFLKEISQDLLGHEYPWGEGAEYKGLGQPQVQPEPQGTGDIPGALSSWLKPSRTSAFLMVAANIEELAANQRQKLEMRDDLQQIDPRQKGQLRTLLRQIEDENFKLMPWAVREWKKGRLSPDGAPMGMISAHSLDIINQAGTWIAWANEYHRPVPDYMSKQFMFEQMEAWVYEMSAANKTETEEESQWADETKVFEWPDGWYMAIVSPDDARLEGELMGHCVGGYCDAIRRGSSWIYSLRDPKSNPHVTLEFEDYGPTDGNDPGSSVLEVVQIQGKSDRKPIDEYITRIREWFNSLKEMGYTIQWASGSVQHDQEQYVDPEYDYDNQLVIPVTKLSDLPAALEVIERDGLTSFQEDDYTGNYKDVPFDGEEDEYGLSQDTTKAEVVIPASFVSLGEVHGVGGEGHDFLINLWKEFLNALIQNPNRYSEEEIQTYVKAFFFIPFTDHNMGRYYPGLPDAATYLSTAEQMEYAAPKPPKPPQEQGLFDPQEYSDQFTSPRIWQKFQYAVNYMFALAQGYKEKVPGRRQRHYPGMGDTWVADPEGDENMRYLPEHERQHQYTDPYQLRRNPPADHYYQIDRIPGAYSSIVYAFNERTGKVEAWDLEGKVVACYDWDAFEPKDSTWKISADEGQWSMGTTPNIAPPEQAVMQALQADPAARQAYEVLSRAGGHVYAVGGAVRDAMLGKAPKDIDLMVVGLPADQVEATLSTLGRVDITGKAFGVFRIRIGDSEVEIALPRSEQSTGVGHTDFAVNADHTLTPEEDLLRRDFTANAMALHLDTGELLDPFNGRGDLTTGTLRTVSPQSFQDDPLRIMRALVAQARHGLTPDEDTLAQMREHADKIRHLPGERIQMELDKLLSAADPVRALEIADDADVLDHMIPEVAVTMGFEQNNAHHDLDVGRHLFAVLNHMANISDDPDLRLAALLHDVGKPDSYWEDEQGRGHFYEHKDYPNSQDHDKLGAQYADALMRRLKYPTTRIERVKKLIEMHMFPAFTNTKGARKFLQRAGSEKMAWDLLRLRMADHSGKSAMGGGMGASEQAAVNQMMELLSDVLDDDTTAVSVKDLAINGKDLLSIGVPQGPQMGEILNELLELVVADPTRNDREELLGLARQMSDA